MSDIPETLCGVQGVNQSRGTHTHDTSNTGSREQLQHFDPSHGCQLSVSCQMSPCYNLPQDHQVEGSLQTASFQEQLQEERQRAKEERRLRELAERRAEQAEDRTRRTTFEELLESCHRVSQSMSVQTDKSLSTQGSMTSPKDKCCPTTIRPWEDFPVKRQSAFDEVYTTLHPPNNTSPRLFSPLLYIEELGRLVICYR